MGTIQATSCSPTSGTKETLAVLLGLREDALDVLEQVVP